jgi:hypothetical protein
LDRLSAPPAAAPAPASAPPPAPTVREEKLAALTKLVEPVAPAPVTTSAPTKPVSAEELRKGDEKLAALVKKQDGS